MRAASVAICEDEKRAAQFWLAEMMLSLGKREKALPIIDSIISEFGPDSSNRAFIDGLILRWRITKTNADFQLARDAVKGAGESRPRHHFGGVLIDEGKYAEAEDILAADIETGDTVAQMLLTDARIRSGNADSARQLFLRTQRDQISSQYQYPYAVTACQVALSCRDEEIRGLAILSLSEILPTSPEEEKHVKDLLLSLQSDSHWGKLS